MPISTEIWILGNAINTLKIFGFINSSNHNHKQEIMLLTFAMLFVH